MGENKHVILLKIDKMRRQSQIKAKPEPIIRSEYAQSLWEEGAGWKND